MRKALSSLVGIACVGFLLFACTSTYTESDLAEEPLGEPTVEAPNCSLLADEAGCEEESPFDHDDEEL